MESLFGAPTANSAPAENPADAPQDFDPNPFDFALPSADDNDNISALLPGLQDYANNQPGETGDADFDNIFNTDLGDAGGREADGGQGGGGLNDFMDFDFDAEFGGGAGEGGDGNANVNASANLEDDFNFDFS